jgi:CRP-like cAMP-binding protein
MNAVLEQKRARDLTTDDRAQIIRRLEFGSSLNEDLVSDMARNSVVLDFRRRRFVYRAGEPADCLYAIIHGRIKLCRIESDTTREAVIDILPEGSLFGESALYSGNVRTAQLPTKIRGSCEFRSGISNGGWLRMTNFMITLSV